MLVELSSSTKAVQVVFCVQSLLFNTNSQNNNSLLSKLFLPVQVLKSSVITCAFLEVYILLNQRSGFFPFV